MQHRVHPRARTSALALGAALMALALLAGCSSTTAGPPQPTSGLGATGPCSITSTTLADPARNQTINIYNPGGTALSPNTGGRCNDSSRPVTVVVHGLAGQFAFAYQGIIDHMVSHGNVVVFAPYDTNPGDFAGSYGKEVASILLAGGSIPRGDKTRLGLIGHSMGGGALPYISQQLVSQGWGTSKLWLFALAPWTIAVVPSGTINVPSYTQAVIENYDPDGVVDNGIGRDFYRRLSVPASQKQYVLLSGDTRNGVTIAPSHLTPLSAISPDDTMKFYGIYRTADALQTCSLAGANCSADLSFMGTWPGGPAFKPALSTDNPPLS